MCNRGNWGGSKFLCNRVNWGGANFCVTGGIGGEQIFVQQGELGGSKFLCNRVNWGGANFCVTRGIRGGKFLCNNGFVFLKKSDQVAQKICTNFRVTGGISGVLAVF